MAKVALHCGSFIRVVRSSTRLAQINNFDSRGDCDRSCTGLARCRTWQTEHNWSQLTPIHALSSFTLCRPFISTDNIRRSKLLRRRRWRQSSHSPSWTSRRFRSSFRTATRTLRRVSYTARPGTRSSQMSKSAYCGLTCWRIGAYI